MCGCGCVFMGANLMCTDYKLKTRNDRCFSIPKHLILQQQQNSCCKRPFTMICSENVHLYVFLVHSYPRLDLGEATRQTLPPCFCTNPNICCSQIVYLTKLLQGLILDGNFDVKFVLYFTCLDITIWMFKNYHILLLIEIRKRCTAQGLIVFEFENMREFVGSVFLQPQRFVIN